MPTTPLENLRRLCLALPEVTERRTPRLWHGPRSTGSRRWTACRRWWRD